MRLAIILLSSSLAMTASLQADQVWLRNGKSLEGEFSRLADGRVEIKTGFGSFKFAADQIVRVERGATFEQKILGELAALDPSNVEGRYALALESGQGGAFSLEQQILHDVLVLDPDHRRAREDLGFHRFQDRWVTDDELHELRGEVRFRDRWMMPGDKEAILAEESRIATLAREKRDAAILDAFMQARLDLMQAEIRQIQRQQAARDIYWDEVGIPIYPYPHPTPYPYDARRMGKQIRPGDSRPEAQRQRFEAPVASPRFLPKPRPVSSGRGGSSSRRN